MCWWPAERGRSWRRGGRASPLDFAAVHSHAPGTVFGTRSRSRAVERTCHHGALGALGPGVLGRGIGSLFALTSCGPVSYGMVMVAVMRRELGLYPGGR